MRINIAFDAGTTDEAFMRCVYAARDFLCANFTGGNQFNIQAGLGTLGGAPLSGLGASVISTTNAFTYSQIRTAVGAKALSDNALAAFNANWPVSDPTGGVPGTDWLMCTALAKTLGLQATDTGLDGFFGLGLPHTFDYTPDNTTPPAGGAFKAFSVIMHEITENMGRQIGVLPSLMCCYKGAGVRELTTFTNAHYLSINNGVTNIRSWNTNPAGDPGDWAGAGGGLGDSFNAFVSNILNPVDEIDMVNMDVIGYGRVTPQNPNNAAIGRSGRGRF